MSIDGARKAGSFCADPPRRCARPCGRARSGIPVGIFRSRPRTSGQPLRSQICRPLKPRPVPPGARADVHGVDPGLGARQRFSLNHVRSTCRFRPVLSTAIPTKASGDREDGGDPMRSASDAPPCKTWCWARPSTLTAAPDQSARRRLRARRGNAMRSARAGAGRGASDGNDAVALMSSQSREIGPRPTRQPPHRPPAGGRDRPTITLPAFRHQRVAAVLSAMPRPPASFRPRASSKRRSGRLSRLPDPSA